MGAGIRASWTASSGKLVLEAEGTADSSPFDVLVDGKLAHRVTAAGRVSYGLAVETLKPGTSVQLWLPQFGTVRIHEASPQGEGVQPVTESGNRWLTYGSSLTHCQQADGPSETWPALVANRYGWELTSLGFAGECQLDPAAESTLQQLPADVISGRRCRLHPRRSRRIDARYTSSWQRGLPADGRTAGPAAFRSGEHALTPFSAGAPRRSRLLTLRRDHTGPLWKGVVSVVGDFGVANRSGVECTGRARIERTAASRVV